MSARNAILKAKIEGVIQELMVKTDAANVYVDNNTTLAAKLTSIIADIATKASTTELTSGLATKAAASHTHAQSEVTGLTDALALLASTESVNSAIDALRQEMLGDTPVEAYNTFTELAAYIAEHQEVSDALSAAIGTKADKATTLAGYGIADAYTKTEADQKIADALAAATGGESAADVKVALEAYEESNDARVDALEAAVGESGSVATRIATAKSEAISTAAADATSKANAAETNAKTYADGLNTAMDTRVDALEADTHTHANKAELDLIASGDKTKWDAAADKAHEHANKTVLDSITADNVSAWTAKSDSNIYYSSAEPASLTDKDLWVQLV